MFLWSHWPNQIRHSQQDLRDDDNNKLLDYKWKPMWFWCWHDSFEYKHAFFRCIFIYVVYQHGTSLNTKRMTTSMMETLIKRNIVMSFLYSLVSLTKLNENAVIFEYKYHLNINICNITSSKLNVFYAWPQNLIIILVLYKDYIICGFFFYST